MPGARVDELSDAGAKLFAPVDAASLVVFRVAFGLLMTWEAVRHLAFGWVRRDYVEPSLHFTYFGFEWVRPASATGMTALFATLAVLGVCVAVGAFYRVAAALLFVGFSWVFLLDAAYYLNHLYLVCLLAFLLPWMPLHRAFSVDAVLRPSLRADSASGWPLHLLRLFVSLIYFFGGVAKLTPDWLRAQPLLQFLEARRDLPVVGPVLAHDATAWFMSYAGLAFDLAVGPLLLYRRTRPYALVAACLFHLTNSMLFEIGIFPWLMLAATTLFCDPSWPRRLRLLPPHRGVVAPVPTGRLRTALTAAMAAWFVVHTVLPLRHWAYPGDVAWTEEGHRFSWRMKLRDKEGRARFRLEDLDTGERWVVHPEGRLPKRSEAMMRTRPDLLLQYAHHLAAEARAQGHARVAVYADVEVRLNGRRAQRLVDPSVDLATQPRTLGHASWILPLTEPLPGWEPDARPEDQPPVPEASSR